jgi:hypothetical protein
MAWHDMGVEKYWHYHPCQFVQNSHKQFKIASQRVGSLHSASRSREGDLISQLTGEPRIITSHAECWTSSATRNCH